MSAAQLDETASLAQAHTLSDSHLKDCISNSPISSPTAASLCRVTHHREETPAPRQATPSSAPSHIDATPDPKPVYLTRVPYCKSPRARPDETSKYERKPRRKTRPDRYDTSQQHQKTINLSRHERRQRKRENLRSRKEIMTNFYSSAVENRHVLMKPALATGAFVNGRGSVSTPLTDLTFNELTFPIIQRSVPRAASPQPPNGARKRPSELETKSLDQIDKHSKRPLVTEDCPDTPTPPPRRSHGERPTQMQLPHAETDRNTTPKEDIYPRNTTPRPIIRYVDSGVDAMSSAGDLGPGDVTDARHVQRPYAGHGSNEQANFLLGQWHLPPHRPRPKLDLGRTCPARLPESAR
ncbi:hypothetical protein CCM_06347 [Cordyceps militaris CM01]|uniref:Uncharacterized protein n=1 Tax=Cordyceps militaris (strain CM01) TaxID=983644 RepID=G3JK56_CORMM|nr:uncharacterized protein CCM_06347 [Cordyceps militaris CM01]EGX92186.1 hypothetical protein CCM_06347 [Cordyceps militaris CM01]